MKEGRGAVGFDRDQMETGEPGGCQGQSFERRLEAEGKLVGFRPLDVAMRETIPDPDESITAFSGAGFSEKVIQARSETRAELR